MDKKEYETHYQDGSINIQKEIYFDPNEEKTPENILKKFGYNPELWELTEWRFGKWEVAIKDEKDNRICTTIRVKIKPKKQAIDLGSSLKLAEKAFMETIQPKEYHRVEKQDLDNNLLMEIPAIELHLGKMAWNGDVGADYDFKIAEKRFEKIIEECINEQDIRKCNTLFMTIGNDFFNSDTVDATTTKGTPQQNDLRWKKMFIEGLQLYTWALQELEPYFNKIDIRLCSGNHDKMSSFYLYMALKAYFRNDPKINFSDNYKDVQCYKFGKNAIFFAHGDNNLKRLIKSIPAEFYKEWGSSFYRELHLGHLHKETVVDDESGLITRRIGSPTGTDQWHYEERFIGATQKHQIFIWDKNYGLIEIRNINFEPKVEKPKTLYRKR